MAKWSSDELHRLRAEYGVKTDLELSRALGKGLSAIQEKAAELALGKDKRRFPGKIKMPRWSDGEVAMLRRLYPTRSTVDVARRLGRSKKSVDGKAVKMGLRKSEERLIEAGRENIQLRRDRGAA